MQTLQEVYQEYSTALIAVRKAFKKMTLDELDIQFEAYKKHFGYKPRHVGDIESWRARQIIGTTSS